MIEIVPADWVMIEDVLNELRDIDREELEACDADLSVMAEFIRTLSLFSFCALYDGEPVAVWGLIGRRPGVANAFAFGTDQWPRVMRPMLRNIREFCEPAARDMGLHRIEAVALTSRRDVAGFMRALGAVQEARLVGYGKGGEDFTMYRWSNGRGSTKASAALHAAHTLN